ncbi:radical SAM protein [Azospirillum sp. 11R-A]|uniref:SPASM domain-containing protein n=1 Tax=Azospirillum sp. 11R-A TaxID=3111634 RepID=UPI003C136531
METSGNKHTAKNSAFAVDSFLQEYYKKAKSKLSNEVEAVAAIKEIGRFYRKDTGFSHLLEAPSTDIRPYFRIDADHTAFLAYVFKVLAKGIEPTLPAPDVLLDEPTTMLLKSMVEMDPSWRHGLLLLARSLLSAGRFNEAVLAARKAHQLSPNCHFGEAVLGDTLRAYRTVGGDVEALNPSVVERTLLRDFHGRYCERPFRNFEVDEKGDAHICCGGLVGGAAIGNVHHQSYEEIWNSSTAEAFRRSCTDGSFTYCSRSCGMMMGDALPDAADLPTFYQHPMQIGPEFINLKHDITCNLWCSSCRDHVIAIDESERQKLDVVLDRVIFPLLKNAKELRIAGGELFASKHYRQIVKQLTRETYPSLKFRLITNGTLLTEREWDRFPDLADMIDCLEVSVDAATEETYRLVRRGGNWKTLQSNLEGISKRHKAGLFPEFRLNFVVQQANYREMPAFVKMARQLGASVRFDPVHNQMGAFVEGQYELANIYRTGHPDFEDFLRILEDNELSGDDVMLIRPEQKMIVTERSKENESNEIYKDQIKSLQIIFAAGHKIPLVDTSVNGLLEGWFERSSGNKVEGWVWSPAFPDLRLPIRVWHNGVPIAEDIANRSRGDLERAGKGDGCHGFIINLPPQNPELRKQDLTITIGNDINRLALRK